VMRVIETAYPEKRWDKLEMMLPDWKDIGESPRFAWIRSRTFH
jgi:hypothetical protein